MTAVIVAHDGAGWLPEVVAALRAQTRPVQRMVAVDTGSRDRSGAVLAELLGTESVFGAERATGFGTAVAQALRHRAASAPLDARAGSAAGSAAGSGPSQDAVEWLWLLHDDCAPEPDALEQLMLVAALGRTAVVGPKVRNWDDPRVLAEAGLRIDRAGRRVTGLDPGEYDQGQHDGDRDVLAVGSAGMLVRRDVWDSLGGFDPALPLFYDDIDFCWRVNAAGYRVRLFTGAAVRHAEAAASGRRTASAFAAPPEGFPVLAEPAPRLRRAARRSGLYVLLANLPLGPMLVSLLGNTVGSVLRALLALLVVKRPAAAWDELAALGSVVGHPVRLLLARRRRPRGRRRTYRIFRSSLPRRGPLALFAEITALPGPRAGRSDGAARIHGNGHRSGLDGLGAVDAAGLGRDRDARHRATPRAEPPGDSAREGQPDGEPPARGRLAHRVMTSPGVLIGACLTLVTLIAGRSLLAAGALGGGAMVPAWGGASDLWQEYLTGFHHIGVGSASAVSPYVAVLAVVATILGGKPWLAVELLLLGSVPLAGVTAYLASRRITRWMPARIWAGATYALLPAATGAVAAGRIGTAVTIALLPLAGILAARMLSGRGRQARRAAWAASLAVAVAAAFVPLVWALAACLAALAIPLIWVLGTNRRATMINLAIAAVVPAALLFPWTLELFAHPSLFLAEAGIPQPGLSDPALPASSLLLFSPGGPGVPALWVTTGIAAAGLAALLRRSGRFPIAAGWLVALFGLMAAIVVSRLSEVPPGAGQTMNGWPGVPLALAASGVLLAALAASEPVPVLLRTGRTGDDTIRAKAAPRGVPGARFRGSPWADAIASFRGIQSRRVPWRRTCTALIVVTACSAPLLAAGVWISRGAAGPLGRAGSTGVPALVSAWPGSGARPGTLVLRPVNGSMTYTVLRGAPPLPGEAQLSEPGPAQRRLGAIVAALASGSGGELGGDADALASFGIGYVLLPAPVRPGLSRLLDGTSGLRQLSISHAFALWGVNGDAARVRVTEPGGAVVPVPSGATDVEGAAAPRSGGTLVLAEPAGTGWRASLNGQPLASLPRPADGWAQAFRLPPGGGRLDVTRDMTGHVLAVLAEGLTLLVVAGLALPGLETVGGADGAHAPGAAARRRPATRARHRRQALPARRARQSPEPEAPAPGGQIAHVPGAHAPVSHGPAVHEPAVHEPAVHEPAVHEPAVHEPAVHEPAVAERAVYEAVAEEAAIPEAVAEEAAVNEALPEEVPTHGPVADEAAAPEPVAEGDSAEQNGAGDDAAWDDSAGEDSAGEDSAGADSAEDEGAEQGGHADGEPDDEDAAADTTVGHHREPGR